MSAVVLALGGKADQAVDEQVATDGFAARGLT
jgi:hypothetical protein